MLVNFFKIWEHRFNYNKIGYLVFPFTVLGRIRQGYVFERGKIVPNMKTLFQ